MDPGEVVAGRFALEALAGVGGMGRVFRARDLVEGGTVALKVLLDRDGPSAPRFGREALVLADLRHPRIVRYVAHGMGPTGPWIAMEWLDGESLAQRLARGRPSVAEALEIAVGAAEALAFLHGRGVLHRDVKPSNLFLAGGEARRLKLLDFGTVRAQGVTRTHTGAVIGTPGYMAPEQVQGAADLDARADVFSLGAVLFECLTGRPAFPAAYAVAVLAKILFEPTPRASAVMPDVPPAIDALVARLMAKDPAERPRDAFAALAEIAAARPSADGAAPSRPASVPAALTLDEQQMLSVILAEEAVADDLVTVDFADATEAVSRRDPGTDLRATAARFGARLVELGGGAIAVTLHLREAATDQAAQAARCALALRGLLPGASMALATGRGTAGRPVGDAIDRAASLLGAGGRRVEGVALDEATAGLLDARFEVLRDEGGLRLAGEPGAVTAERPLLGKPSCFVGRDLEIGLLLGHYEDCAEEPRARAVLVTGPPGAGKSRLARELLRRLAARPDPPSVLVARGDPLRAGSPFGLVAPAIRRAADIEDGEPAARSRDKLRARVGRRLPGDQAERVAEFLGELAGTPFPEGESPRIAAARRAPVLMADQIRAAFRAFLDAEADRAPVVLLLEDLHFGDLASTRLVDHALQKLAARPLFVIALARPEVEARLPSLSLGRALDTLRLGDLPRRASEALARDALGPGAGPEVIARIADHGAGNPLYLEELVRAAAAGRDTALPGSVLAMIAARLDAIEPGARRVLRAASILGDVLRDDGVAALLGGDARREESRAWLSVLVDQEILERRERRSGGPGEEYAFRHTLVRDAAYALLTDADRALGHRLAGEWLERAGEPSAAAIAEHFERSDRPARAGVHWLRAAEQAFARNEARAALASAGHGVRAGLAGEDLGRARLVEARAHAWLAESADAAGAVTEALALLPHGGDAWLDAAAVAANIALSRGQRDLFLSLVADVEQLAQGPAPTTALFIACARVTTILAYAGDLPRAHRLLDAYGPRAREAGERAPIVLATYLQARGTLAGYEGDAALAFDLLVEAARVFDGIGDVRGATIQRANAGCQAVELGAYAEAERLLRGVIAEAEPLGLDSAGAIARQNLGVALARLGALDEAMRLEGEAIRIYVASADRRLEGSSRTALAMMHAAAGALDAAAEEAGRAVDLLSVAPPLRAAAYATLARVELARGRTAAALEAAGEAHALATSPGGIEEGESLVRLAWAEALDAAGRREEAAAAVASAADRLLARAARIADADRRARFLGVVPENARTLELAAQWRAPPA